MLCYCCRGCGGVLDSKLSSNMFNCLFTSFYWLQHFRCATWMLSRTLSPVFQGCFHVFSHGLSQIVLATDTERNHCSYKRWWKGIQALHKSKTYTGEGKKHQWEPPKTNDNKNKNNEEKNTYQNQNSVFHHPETVLKHKKNTYQNQCIPTKTLQNKTTKQCDKCDKQTPKLGEGSGAGELDLIVRAHDHKLWPGSNLEHCRCTNWDPYVAMFTGDSFDG